MIIQNKNFEKGLVAVKVVPDMHKDFPTSRQGSWSITSKVVLGNLNKRVLWAADVDICILIGNMRKLAGE